MCLPARLCVVLLAMGLSSRAICAQSSGVEESLEGWLEQHGLYGLVAAQLERRLDGAEGRRRNELAQRLAQVYARLLEESGEGEQREELIARGQQLLDRVQEADTVELRLSLGRAAYSGVEGSVERVRLRIEDAEDSGALAAHLIGLDEQFREIGVLADQRVRALEKQEESGNAQANDDLLGRTLAQARRHRSLARYYGGWSCVYLAELLPEARAEYGAAALRHFGWLLNAQRGQRADPERVPEGLMEYEHVARAAVGCALASALLGQRDVAGEWLSLVDNATGVSEEVRDKLGVYRVLSLGYSGAWIELEAAVREARGEGTMDALLARLVCVLSFEAKVTRRAEQASVDLIGKIALGDLVARNETGHVLDLVSRYPEGAGSGRGFMAVFLGALRDYDDAQGAHIESGGSLDEPASDQAVRSLYLRAGIGFADAFGSDVAGEYGEAKPSVAVLRGLSLYYGSDASPGFREGSVWFRRAWELLSSVDETRAKEALWMAVRCAKLGIDAGAGSAVQREHDTLVNTFVQAYPDDTRTAHVVFERAASPDRDPERAVAELLSIERDSSVYESARREAAGLLYELYQDAEPDRRAWAARRYAEVAERLLANDTRPAMEGDERAVAQAVLRSRRIAEVMLSSPEPDSARAEGALDVLVGLVSRGSIEVSIYQTEIWYRRAQIALERRDYGEAERLVALMDQMEDGDAGARLLYRDAVRRFTDSDEDPAGEDAARGVVMYGRRVIASLLDQEDVPLDGVLFSVQSDVAQASAVLWRISGDGEYLELGRRLASVLLHAQPYDTEMLMLAGTLAEGAGEYGAAMEHWRVLVAGSQRGGDAWFEARVHQLHALERVDRTKALASIQQHVHMYPTYGPEPWGDQLKAIHARLTGGGGDGG